MSKIQSITTIEFEEKVLNSSIPVFVDFWADWCGPCKAIEPILVELAEEYKGKLHIYKMNIDQEGEIASSYGIMSIPTLLLFRDGIKCDQMIGSAPKSNFIKFFEKNSI